MAIRLERRSSTLIGLPWWKMTLVDEESGEKTTFEIGDKIRSKYPNIPYLIIESFKEKTQSFCGTSTYLVEVVASGPGVKKLYLSPFELKHLSLLERLAAESP